MDDSNLPGIRKWPIRAMRGLDWWARNGKHCSVCIWVCPWSKPNNLLHKMVRFFADRNIATRLIVGINQVTCKGKHVLDEPHIRDASVEKK